MGVKNDTNLVLRSLVTELIGHGFALSVHNEEATEIEDSTDIEAVIAELWQCDMEELTSKKGDLTGWFSLVYGNDGYDVISDYTVNMEPFIADTMTLVDKLAE